MSRLSLDASSYTARQRAFKDCIVTLISLFKSTFVKGAHLSGSRLTEEGDDKISLFMLIETFDTLQRSSPE